MTHVAEGFIQVQLMNEEIVHILIERMVCGLKKTKETKGSENSWKQLHPALVDTKEKDEQMYSMRLYARVMLKLK